MCHVNIIKRSVTIHSCLDIYIPHYFLLGKEMLCKAQKRSEKSKQRKSKIVIRKNMVNIIPEYHHFLYFIHFHLCKPGLFYHIHPLSFACINYIFFFCGIPSVPSNCNFLNLPFFLDSFTFTSHTCFAI